MKTKVPRIKDERNMYNMDAQTTLQIEKNLNVYAKRKERATKAGVCAEFRSSYLRKLDEEDIEKFEIQKLAMDVVAKLNDEDSYLEPYSESHSELEFLDIEKAEYVYACGGRFYFLQILVEDGYKAQTIEKMVWQGTSSQVLSCEKRNLSSEEKENTMNIYSSTKKIQDLADMVMFDIEAPGEGMEMEAGMTLVRVINVKEHPETVTDGPAIGLFKFKTFTLTLEATTMKGTSVAIEALVLHREWFQLMDNKKEDFFRSWRDRMLRATEPPDCPTNPKPVWHFYGEPIPLMDCDTLYYPIDLCSPQIHTQIWLVLEDHNYKEKTHLEFVKVIKAISSPTAGKIFNLTFQANDQGTIRTYQIEVLHAIFAQFWKPLTPLNLCPAGDEDGEQIGQKIDMYNSTAFAFGQRRYSKRKKSSESFQASVCYSKRRSRLSLFKRVKGHKVKS